MVESKNNKNPAKRPLASISDLALLPTIPLPGIALKATLRSCPFTGFPFPVISMMLPVISMMLQIQRFQSGESR